MAKLTELWKGHPGQAYQHPLIRFIDTAHPQRSMIEVNRPPDLLGFKPASIFFYWSTNGIPQAPQQYAWDTDLNTALVQRGIRSVTAEAEVVRHGLAFKEAFKTTETRFGNGFFNGVLILVLQELGFADEQVVADKLNQIAPGNPSRRGNSFGDCFAAIREILKSRATELVEKLGYSQDEAGQILTDAVAYYLDERFSVTTRQRLGF